MPFARGAYDRYTGPTPAFIGFHTPCISCRVGFMPKRTEPLVETERMDLERLREENASRR